MSKKIIFTIVLLSIIYMITYKAYHSWLNKNYSGNNAYSLRWLYRLIIAFALPWFLWTPYTILDYLIFNFKVSIYVLLALITIWISAKAFLRPEVVLLEASSETTIDKEKPSEEIFKKASWLKEQMVTNLFYLNSDLTLKSLADNLHMHPNVLSKIINGGLDKNFSDFVNEYRVNAIIEKLHSGNYDHMTLLGISFECGFNSKTTFNRVFKNIKGVTPLDYKKSIKNDAV